MKVTNLEHNADFNFQLFPYPKEYVVMVGEIGYYYPAHMWIGNSGLIYCTHDYEDDMKKYDSIVELILNKLLLHDFGSVAMKP